MNSAAAVLQAASLDARLFLRMAKRQRPALQETRSVRRWREWVRKAS